MGSWFLALLMIVSQPPAPVPVEAPVDRPLPSLRLVPDQGCTATAPNNDEVVVCGRNGENSPYRIPRELRGPGIVEDRHASWDARFRDESALERFSSQNVGPSGISQHGRQVDCEWRAARQMAAGRRPDCGRRRLPGE